MTDKGDRSIWCTLLLAFAVRAWGIDGQSLSMDEHFEVNQTRLSLPEIVTTGDGFPPLYQLLHAGWNRITGDGGARWLSVVMGLALVAVIDRIGRRIGGPAVGRSAALVSALLPIHVWFSQEARAYSLVMLITGLAIWAALSVLERSSAENGDGAILPNRPVLCSTQNGPVPFVRWSMLAGTCVLGMYTHYYFVFIVALVGGYLLWSFGGRIGRDGWFSVGGGLLALLPLAWLLSQDLATQVGWPHKRHFGLLELGFTYFTFLSGFTLGPSFEELHELSTSVALRQFAPWLALASVSGSLLVMGATSRRAVSVLPCARNGTLDRRQMHQRANARRSPENIMWPHGLPLLFLLATGVLVTGVASNVLDVGYQVRYAVWASVPCAIVLGWLVAQSIATRPGRLGTALLMVLAFCALFQRHADLRYANPDVRAVARYLAANSSAEPVIVISDYMTPVFGYYVNDPRASRQTQLIDVPAVTPESERAASLVRQFNQAVAPGRRFWLLLCRDFHQDPKHALRDELLQRATVVRTQSFAGATLIELRRKP